MMISNKAGSLMRRSVMAMLLIAVGLAHSFADERNDAKAAALIKEAVAKITGQKAVSVHFTLSMQGPAVSGQLLSSGGKFRVKTRYASIWYDGKSMWTYSADSKETTVIKPTSEELVEANPLLMLNSKTLAAYNCVFEKGQNKAGRVYVILTPKKKGSGVKKVRIILNTSTKLPLFVGMLTSSGESVGVSVLTVNTHAKAVASDFVYPKSSYKGVRVVDLR